MSTLNIWRNSPMLRLGLALGSGLTLLIGLLLVMGIARPPDVALAQDPIIRYVDGASGSDSGDCTNSSAPCATVQYAVDVADPGDEIHVATGTYTGVHARPRDDVVATGVVTQVVYISKTVTIRGGYTSAFTDPPDPVANPIILDAPEGGRVLYVTGNISPTIEGLHITGGNAAGLGGREGGPHAGGGIYIITAATTISNNQVFSNTI